MSKEQPNEGNLLWEFVKKIPGHITAVIGFITVVGGAVLGLTKWLRGDTETAVFIVLYALILIAWQIALFICFKKASTSNYDARRGRQLSKKYAYSRTRRYFSLGAAFTLTILVFVGRSYFIQWRNSPSDKNIILIADFPSLDGRNYAVTEKIIMQLRNAIDQFQDIQIQALSKPITEQEGSEVARAYGKQYKATLVLWGWYNSTQDNALITIHFEVLQKPRDLRLKQEQQELNLSVQQLNTFQIQTQLSNEMTYLSLLTIGLARLEANDYKNAVALFSKALEQKPVPEQMIDPANIYFFRGNAYLNLGENDRAITDYNKAFEITPENFCTACAYNNRGIAYLQEANYDAALADFIQSKNHDPAPAEIYENIGATYEKKGDYDHAMDAYSEAINHNPNLPDPYIGLGNAYFYKKDYDKAIYYFTEYLKLKPDALAALNNRGIAYAKKGDYAHAIDDVNRSRVLDPNWSTDKSPQEAGLIDKATFIRELDTCNAAIAVNPKDFNALFKRGVLYRYVADYDRAINDLNQAINLNPNFAQAYHHRGMANEYNGNKEQAIADYRRFLELAPDEATRNDAKSHLQKLGVTP